MEGDSYHIVVSHSVGDTELQFPLLVDKKQLLVGKKREFNWWEKKTHI